MLSRILVTGAGGPAGVNALRLLQRIPDVTAFAADMDELSAGRFFAKEFRTMPGCKDKAAYSAALKQMVADWKIEAILPTVGEELLFVREALEGVEVKIMVSPQSSLEICHDKRKQYAWMAEHFPQYMVPWSTADQADDMMWATFAKPAFGRGGRGCRKITMKELELLKQDPKASETIVMEELPGTEWTVDAFIAQDGTVPLIVPRERLALSGGISLKGRTVKREDVIQATRDVVSRMGLRGPICIQWKADATGQPKFVEINPRLSGGLTITAASGADPIAYVVKELRGESLADAEWNEVTVIRYFDEKVL